MREAMNEGSANTHNSEYDTFAEYLADSYFVWVKVLAVVFLPGLALVTLPMVIGAFLWGGPGMLVGMVVSLLLFVGVLEYAEYRHKHTDGRAWYVRCLDDAFEP